MRKITRHLYEYFYYTRAERNASIILALLCLVFFLLPNFYPYILPKKPPTDFSAFRMAILDMDIITDGAKSGEAIVAEPPDFRSKPASLKSVELFKFDPG